MAPRPTLFSSNFHLLIKTTPRTIRKNTWNGRFPLSGVSEALFGPPGSNGHYRRQISNSSKSPTATTFFLRPQLRKSSSFSTAAIPQDGTSDPAAPPFNKKQQRTKRKPIRNRSPLNITPSAAARIDFLTRQHTGNGNRVVGIRLGTKKRGCNGLSYTLNYAYENHLDEHKRDEAMTISLPSSDMPGNGLKVFVEPMALMNIIGTTMDFVDDEMSSEFTFTNPNSKGECGCGESFNV